MRRFVALLLMGVCLSGCASTFSAVFERPVQVEAVPRDDGDRFQHVVTSLTGERRVFVSGPLATDPRVQVVCAETFPDVARGVGATSSANASLPTAVGTSAAATQLSFSDAYTTSLLLTFNRTETADVVRQVGWQNCLAYMNGSISLEKYQENLRAIIDRAFNTLDKSVSRALPAAPATTVLYGGTSVPALVVTQPNAGGQTPGGSNGQGDDGKNGPMAAAASSAAGGE